MASDIDCFVMRFWIGTPSSIAYANWLRVGRGSPHATSSKRRPACLGAREPTGALRDVVLGKRGRLVSQSPASAQKAPPETSKLAITCAKESSLLNEYPKQPKAASNSPARKNSAPRKRLALRLMACIAQVSWSWLRTAMSRLLTKCF